jgi:hypothetical protein
MSLMILDKTPGVLPITLRATFIEDGVNKEETITKDDIEGFYDCRVELNPEKDIQSDREVMLGRTLYKEGMIPWKRLLIDYMHKTEAEADDIIAETLAEQAVATNPLLAQIRVTEAMEQIGATKYLKQIQASQEENQKMAEDLSKTNIPKYRPSEANNPTAVDTLRQVLRETPQGVRNPAGVV